MRRVYRMRTSRAAQLADSIRFEYAKKQLPQRRRPATITAAGRGQRLQRMRSCGSTGFVSTGAATAGALTSGMMTIVESPESPVFFRFYLAFKSPMFRAFG